MICPRCKHEIVRRVEDPLPGEVRRASWWCGCNRRGRDDGPLGEMVEWLPRAAIQRPPPPVEWPRVQGGIGPSGARGAFRQ